MTHDRFFVIRETDSDLLRARRLATGGILLQRLIVDAEHILAGEDTARLLDYLLNVDFRPHAAMPRPSQAERVPAVYPLAGDIHGESLAF